MSDVIRNKIIANGVENLKEFGYPHVNKQNILTDVVYSQFFLNQLKDNLGSRYDIDKVINELISKINDGTKGN